MTEEVSLRLPMGVGYTMEAVQHARAMKACGRSLCTGCGAWFNPVALIAGRCALCGSAGADSIVNASPGTQASLTQPDNVQLQPQPGDVDMSGPTLFMEGSLASRNAVLFDPYSSLHPEHLLEIPDTVPGIPVDPLQQQDPWSTWGVAPSAGVTRPGNGSGVASSASVPSNSSGVAPSASVPVVASSASMPTNGAGGTRSRSRGRSNAPTPRVAPAATDADMLSKILAGVNANSADNASFKTELAFIKANTAGAMVEFQKLKSVQEDLKTDVRDLATRVEGIDTAMDAKIAEAVQVAMKAMPKPSLSAASTDVPPPLPNPQLAVETSVLDVRNFCDFAVVKESGATVEEVRTYMMIWVETLPPELRQLFGLTSYQVVGLPPHWQRHQACKMHCVRPLAEPESFSIAANFSAWASKSHFRGRIPTMHIPKSAEQELADGSLRQLKRLLADSTEVKPDYIWQCRYNLRRIGVISRLDPAFPMSSPGRPKFWPVAGIEIGGRPFLDRTMLSKVLAAPMGEVEVATLEQEMVALVR